MPLGKARTGSPSAMNSWRDLTLALNAVGTLSGHGFNPLKAQLTVWSTHTNPSNCPAQGRTPEKWAQNASVGWVAATAQKKIGRQAAYSISLVGARRLDVGCRWPMAGARPEIDDRVNFVCALDWKSAGSGQPIRILSGG